MVGARVESPCKVDNLTFYVWPFRLAIRHRFTVRLGEKEMPTALTRMLDVLTGIFEALAAQSYGLIAPVS